MFFYFMNLKFYSIFYHIFLLYYYSISSVTAKVQKLLLYLNFFTNLNFYSIFKRLNISYTNLNYLKKNCLVYTVHINLISYSFIRKKSMFPMSKNDYVKIEINF